MENENKTLSYILYITAIFVLLPNKIREIPFVVLSIYSILVFFKDKRFDYKSFIFLSLFFTINIISLLHSSNLKTGLTRVEGFLPFFYLTLSYSILLKRNISFDKKFIFNWIVIFNVSNLIFLIIFLSVYAFKNSIINFNTIRDLLDELPLIGIHSIHLSIIVFLASLTCIYISRQNLKLSILLVIPNIILLGLCASRATFLAFVLLMFYYVFSLKFKFVYKAFLTILVFFSTYLFINMNFEFNRKLNYIFQKESYQKLDLNNSSSIRYAIYNCSIDKIKKSNLFIGNGVGDVRDLMQECYDLKYPTLDKYYNTHNQFISVFLGTGLFGFSCLLLYFIILITQGQNKFLFITVIFYLYIFNFENVLERKYGILIFLFFTMFVFNLFIKKKKY